MKIGKKLVLGLGILATMVMAFVVGIMSDGFSKPLFSRNGVESGATDVLAKAKKPITYTYKAGEVAVQKGGNTIQFDYSPTSSQQDGTKAVAYEYVFGNTLNKKTGVNLKEIDTTDVTVSYAWSPTRLDTDEDITTYADYQLQSLDNDGSKVYIYIFVSPNEGVENIPVTFTRSVVWYYGVPTTMSIINVKTNEKTDHEIITGQEIDAKYMEDVEVPEGKVIKYYLDQKQTISATFPYNNIAGTNLYYRVASIPNLPSDWIGWDSTLKTYYVKKGTSTLPADLVIPEEHTTTTYGTHPVTYINSTTRYSSGVFYNKTTLTSVELPSTLTSIGGYAFYNCSSLTSADLSNCSQLTTIETYAFYNCKALTSVDLSGCTQLTSMGARAFYDCKALTSIDLSNCSQLTSIGDSAFRDCTGLTSVNLSNCSQLTSIKTSAFYNCSGLTGVYISDIEAWCNIDFVNNTANPLYYAKNLYLNKELVTNLTIPSSVTELKKFVFYNCSGLTSIDLSNCSQLTSIGNSAFYGCKALTSIDLSGCTQLTSIGQYAFQNCSALTGVYITNIEDWCNIVFTSQYYSNPLEYAQNLYVNGDLVTSVTIPRSVTELKSQVFRGCTSLTSVTLHNNITSIGSAAFGKCNALKSIDLSECTQLTSIGGSAFSNCSALKSVDLSNCNQLTSMGYGVFNECRALTSVSLPASITTIESMAFANGTSARKIYITDLEAFCNIDFGDSSANPLNNASLYINDQLTSIITLPTTVTKLKPYVFSGDAITSVILHNGITSITGNSFYSSKALVSITIPASVTSIGKEEFMYCYDLKSVKFEDNSQLLSIGASAFSWCTLASITIPASVTMIDKTAFAYTNGITSISVEEGNSVYDSRNNCNAIIETATNTLMRGCSNTVIPSDIQVIGDYAFQDCSTLTSVDLSNCSQLTSIGSHAFAYCSNLTEVVVPSTLIDLGSGAFYNCTSLVYNEIDGGCYLGNSTNPYLVLMKTSDNTITEFTVHADTQVIGPSAFSGNTSLTSIDLSTCTNLKGINSGAFYGCKGLTSITIPASVTSIGQSAFYNCSALISITFETNEGEDLTNLWYRTISSTDWANKENGTVTNLSTPTTNDDYFKSNYYTYYWYKVRN